MLHFTLEITAKDRKKKPVSFSFPEHFGECTDKQLLMICRQRLRNSTASLKKQLLSVYFSGLNYSTWLAIPFEQRAEITVHLDWMIDSERLFDSTIIKHFKLGREKFYGPSDQLTNLSFIEYIHADGFFHQWFQHADEAALYDLLAVLYRPKSGKKRIGFDYEECCERAERWRSKPFSVAPELLMATVIYFVGCQRYLGEVFGDLFPAPEPEEEPTPTTERSYENPWPNAQKRLTTDGRLGTLAGVQQENLYNALDFLQDIVVQDRKNAMR